MIHKIGNLLIDQKISTCFIVSLILEDFDFLFSHLSICSLYVNRGELGVECKGFPVSRQDFFQYWSFSWHYQLHLRRQWLLNSGL